MISFDFEYKRPTTWEEAFAEFKKHHLENKTVMYYAGGTEFISRARLNEIKTDIVIDVKAIPECTVLQKNGSKIVIGTAITLTDAINSNYFPLLSEVARNIATKTARNKITVGGNLMSNLPYKEALLPFLLDNSAVIVASDKGLEKREISHLFTNTINLKKGEFIVQLITDTNITLQPYFIEKVTKQSKINYPILTGASLYVNGKINVAFSGLTHYPFRITEIDEEIDDTSISNNHRIKKIIDLIPRPFVHDMNASEEYRSFVLNNMLTKIIKQMEEHS